MPASPPPTRIVLVRHGETEWSRDRRHTGRTDIPLTDAGRREAAALEGVVDRWRFGLVLTSPLSRATATADLAGLGRGTVPPERTDELLEWDYGRYEGLTSAEIRRTAPGWTVFDDGCPGGEDAAAVGRRVDRLLDRVRAWAVDAPRERPDVALVGHAHVLRVLAARWIGLPPEEGRRLMLDSGSWSVLAHEHESATIARWNVRPDL